MTRRKTILFVEANEDGTVGGSYFSLQLLVKSLDKELYNPIVVLYDNIPLAFQMFSGVSRVIIFHRFLHLAPKWGGGVPEPFSSAWRKLNTVIFRVIFSFILILIILIRNRVSLVHLNNSANYGWDWLMAARILRKRCVVHQRGEFFINPKNLEQARKFDKIICISKAIQQPFRVNNVTNTKLIYNPIDVDGFRSQVEKDMKSVKQSFKIDTTVPFIGMIGNFQEWKGHVTLIRAVELLRKDFPGLICLLVGSFPVKSKKDMAYFDRIKQLIVSLKLEKNIIITGFRDDIPNIINSLDVQLHCSLTPEPFGRVIIEGMCLGKVVVATNIGGPCEIIENGVSGFLVPPQEPDILAEKIKYILENEDVMARIGQAAYLRVAENFSLWRFQKKIHEFYQGMI